MGIKEDNRLIFLDKANCPEKYKIGGRVTFGRVCMMRVRHWVYEATVDWKSVQGPYTKRVPIACMRALLEYEAMADPGTRERFARWARGECRDTRFEVDLAIARKMGRDFSLSAYASPNLDRFFKEAAKVEKAGSHMAAARICKDVAEVIGVHMDLIPDKSGDCQYWMSKALEGIVRCVNAAQLDPAGRRDEVRYLAEWSMRVIDWFATDYGDAISAICRDAADLDVWETVLDNPPVVESGYSGPSGYGAGNLRKILESRRKRPDA